MSRIEEWRFEGCALPRRRPAPRTGDVISGIDAARATGANVYCAGVARDGDGDLVTAGGRVLAVTALGPSLADARTRAYDAASRITWPGRVMRTDIAAAPTS